MPAMPTILFEDNHLLVAVKPPNVPSQADPSGDPDMLTLLKGYIREKHGKPGEVYLGLVHRLDRPVGGVMVFARTSKAAARLSESVRTGGFEKEYLAVVCSQPSGGRLVHWLKKNPRTNMSAAVPEGTPGSLRCELEYEVLAGDGELSLCKIRLLTGRSHQIRVQMAATGHPLWGDARYNPASRPGQQIALWAHKLAFPHPVTRETLVFGDEPQGTPWVWFAPPAG